MKKRIVSLLLVLCLLLSLFPTGTMRARAVPEEDDGIYFRNLWITWGDEEQFRFEYSWNPGTGEESRSGDDLPEGVSISGSSLTLHDAELTQVRFDRWGKTPVTIELLGENRITGCSDDGSGALDFYACHDVTIGGSGSVYLESRFIPLHCNDDVPDSDLNNDFSTFTIRDASITAINTWPDDEVTDDNAWSSSGIFLASNVVLDGADLYTRGHNGFSVEGDLTITGGTKLDADGFNTGAKQVRNTQDCKEFYRSKILIEHADLDISVHRNRVDWDYFVFEIAPGSDLTVRDGADITVDCADTPHDLYAFLIHDDYTEGAGAATMTMEGGRIHVITTPRENCGGLGVGTGATWTQYGGEVLVEAGHPGGDFSLWNDACLNLYGGSITVLGSGIGVGPRSVWNQYGGDVRVENRTAMGCGISLGDDTAFTLTDGTVTLINDCEEVREAPENVWTPGLSCSSRSTLTMTGGKVTTSGDWFDGSCFGGNTIISGGELDLSGVYVGANVLPGSTLTMTGGTMTASGGDWGVQLENSAGMTMLGGSLRCPDAPFILLYGSSVRFLGGEALLGSSSAMRVQHEDPGQVQYGEGICAARSDGIAAELIRTEDGWLDMDGPVTIKSQSAAAASSSLLLSLTDPDRVTTGVNTGVKLICQLTEPEGTVDIRLPMGVFLAENSVLCNGRPIPYTTADDGFSVRIPSGSLVTFSIRTGYAGSAMLYASYGSCEAEVEIVSSAYRLTVPSIVNKPTFPLTGTAAAGSTLTFYCDDQQLHDVHVTSLGTWSTELTLPNTGYHYIYAVLTAADGAVMAVTNTHRVLYDPKGVVAERLTISNWIHGRTMLDPYEQAVTVIDYTTGRVSPGYYVYWPDLPEFTLTAKFADGTGTPSTIYNVRVVATDRRGESVTVPLSYDPQTDTWVGKRDFCRDGTITPEQFRLQYYTYAGYHDPEEPVWEPDHLPEASDTDSTDGAAVLLDAPGGSCTVSVSADAAVANLTDSLGQNVGHTLTDGAVTFPAEPGECYTLELKTGSFPGHPGTDKLCILIRGGRRGEFTYQDNVHPVSSSQLSDRTDTTFTAEPIYAVGDVLMVDGAEALIITQADGSSYTYDAAALDEIYASLDVSGIDTSRSMEVHWGTDRETLLQQFRESAAFRTYLRNLELTLNEWSGKKEISFELDDVKADIRLNYGYRDDGTVYVNPVFTITTKMTTELPWEGELETELTAELGYTVEEDVQYRIRSINDDRDVQSYLFFTDETVTADLSFTVAVGENPNGDGDPSENEEYFSDFEKALEELRSNFLEDLQEQEEESFNPLKDLKLQIPTPIPAVTVFVSPGMEVEWTFFGELKTTAQVVNRTTKGILITHLGDYDQGSWTDWSVRTFSEKQAPEAALTASMHLSASLGLMLRVDLGVCVAQCLDLGLYASAGPKITINGHGHFAISSDGSGSSSQELLAALILEAEAGASLSLSLKKLPFKLPKLEKELYSAAWPLAELGERIMPWEFATIESGTVHVTSICDLKQYIDLNLKCQYFNVDGSIEQGKQVMPLQRYRFELLSAGGSVSVSPDGRVTVKDLYKEFDFRVKVTYTGSDPGYKIWKVLDLHYSPSSITIHKSAEDAPPVASFMIYNLTNPYEAPRGATTSEEGIVTVPAASGCTYHIVEVCPPPDNLPVEGEQTLYVNGEAHIGFSNYKPEEPEPDEPPSPIIPPIADPSGYVFEGIEGNRLEGVTASLFVADDEAGTNARLWDAAPFDQVNPLLTDSLGQYQWMVPDGWWQVRYSLDGYESAESGWMVVPPIRTGVNQNLVTDAPAELRLHWSDQHRTLAVLFSRPVIASSPSVLSASIDGEAFDCWLSPMDGDWSVTEDPLDSRMCATAFSVFLPEGLELLGKTVTITIDGAVTYYGTPCGTQTAETQVPEALEYRLNVDRGSGSGWYRAGETVTVTAYENGCFPFDHWEAWGIGLEDDSLQTISFPMPREDVSLTAWYGPEEVHDYAARVTPPTCTEQGFTTHTCSRCGNSFTDSFTEPLGHDWQGLECSRCDALRPNPFTDVPEDSFYYEPVLWAVKNGVTNGTTPTTFSPDDQCMRAHVVTFLWRAAGSPEPLSSHNPFLDVTEKDFYYKAVLWAVEKGVTNGLDATHFGPYAYCNRAQVVTFLHRSLGSPEVTGTRNPFADVPDDQWFTVPVLWAVESGVTNGLSATAFGPDSICNRAQIVTFLYRAFTG